MILCRHSRGTQVLDSSISSRQTEEPPGGRLPIPPPVLGSFLSRGDEMFVLIGCEARSQVAFDFGERSLVCGHVEENGSADSLPLQLACGFQSVPTQYEVVAFSGTTHHDGMSQSFGPHGCRQ